MGGVLTLPELNSGEKHPGLLLIYEAFGLGPEMKRVARDFAREGYVVLIPDLFDRGPKALCVAQALRAISTQQGKQYADLEAARRWLAARPEVDGTRLGVVGFCLGGGFALVLATTGKYRVAAPFYGEAPKSMPQSCPIVASFGGRDEVYSKGAPILKKNLESLGIPHDVKVYPEAGHSFYTATQAGLFGYLGGILPMHASHHEESARDARARVLAFFREHLDGNEIREAKEALDA